MPDGDPTYSPHLPTIRREEKHGFLFVSEIRINGTAMSLLGRIGLLQTVGHADCLLAVRDVEFAPSCYFINHLPPTIKLPEHISDSVESCTLLVLRGFEQINIPRSIIVALTGVI